MRNYCRQLKPLLFGSLLLAASMSLALAAVPVEPSTATARVWFLRPSGSADGIVWGASPVISVNGAAIGAIPPDSDFYRDFTPGTDRLSVAPVGQANGHPVRAQAA